MRTLLVAITAACAVISLTGCSAAAPHHTARSAVAHSTGSAASPTPDPDIAVTCAGLTELETDLSAADSERSAGTIEDAGYAAIVDLTPTVVSGMLRTPDRGLVADLTGIQDAVASSPPTVASAQFDPDAPAFRAAMQRAQHDCAANGSPLVAYAPAGQG
ncbi:MULTISPECIES: hypothetical protein [unclassified Curtobacterium]|uniref:hypothetical protein n=1 Tax=unclassified Curtobacterium TaxID=257496 RepID=UPI000DA79BE3|nr:MULTISPECIES: hypothetical protein [unclassified Curtobacterium]WIB68926.1 hypothetical protein DEI93_07820 [Curtobacterium sp. MCBD17_035]WIE56074.1 hypothetical protein DEI88_007755 [Curtobacterium sp. MCBD17_003]